MSRRHARRLWLAIAATCLFTAGLSIGTRAGAPSDIAPTRPDAPSRQVSPTAGSATPRHAVSAPRSPARSREGAVEAATTLVVAFDGPGLLDDTARQELIDQHAARDARSELERVLGGVGGLITDRLALDADELGEAGFVWRTVPAGWRLEEFSRERAVVEVWGTGVVIAHGLPLTQPGWRTTTVELVWERGGWRLQGFDSESGPAPPAVGGTATAAVQARLINTFRPFRHSPADVAGSTP